MKKSRGYKDLLLSVCCLLYVGIPISTQTLEFENFFRFPMMMFCRYSDPDMVPYSPHHLPSDLTAATHFTSQKESNGVRRIDLRGRDSGRDRLHDPGRPAPNSRRSHWKDLAAQPTISQAGASTPESDGHVEERGWALFGTSMEYKFYTVTKRKRTANRSSTTCVGSSALPAHNVPVLRALAMVLMIAAIVVSSGSNQVQALTLPPFFTRPPPASPASEGTISSAASSTTSLGPTKTPLQARDETIWKAGNLRDQFGTSALGQVRNLAAAVQTAGGKEVSRRGLFVARGKNTGGTGSLMRSLEKLDGENEDVVEEDKEEDGEGAQNDKNIWEADVR